MSINVIVTLPLGAVLVLSLGCAIDSQLPTVTGDPNKLPDAKRLRIADSRSEVVLIRRDPAYNTLRIIAKGADLGTPPNPEQVRSLLATLEYCKITSDRDTAAQDPDLIAKLSQSAPSAPLPSTRRTVAGRVISLDDQHILLADAIAVDEDSIQAASAAARKHNPSTMFPRPVRIPGDVRIHIADILIVQSISAAAWPEFRQTGLQRIGIDLD